MIKIDGYLVTPTIFPDKTSQVWRLPEEVFSAEKNLIIWDFESEAELMHLAQLKELLSLYGKRDRDITLHIRYLPYGRQDKYVANDATFALRAFAKQLNYMHFTKVEIFDPHSDVGLENIRNSKAIWPAKEINQARQDLFLSVGDIAICFPDAGASSRYSNIVKDDIFTVIFDKDRDQQTGEILGLVTKNKIEPMHYLIIDDICDGGRTFIEVAKALYTGGATNVSLYVSHGLFTKGKQVLRDAGIKRIFTKNGEEE